MRNKVLRHIRDLGLLTPGDAVVCALSGGADSVAMTHCLLSLRQELGITLSACHFNHKLRDDESDGDEQFCRDFCETHGISLTVSSADVAARSRATGESLEEAARRCRYAFFATLSGKIATAHTADDQAETVLINLIRGTGLKGLGGIPPVRDCFVRPMLTVSRQDVLAYLEAYGLPHREDSTNREDNCVRNRLRHCVLPLLKEENPNLLAGLDRMTTLLRQDEALLQAQADDLLQGDIACGWSLSPLQKAPAALRQRALRTILRACKAPKLSASHILAAETLVTGSDPSARICLPGGWTARREYDRLFLERSTASTTFQPVELPCPGQVYIPELDTTFRCDQSHAAITIRPRREGDVIRLSGGSKTVKKLLIDKKIPVKERERTPILEADGVILSVWGVANASCGMPTITTVTDKGETRHDPRN